MTDTTTTLEAVHDDLVLSTLAPPEGIGENTLARDDSTNEPLGAPEVAAYLGVSRTTLYQWSYRDREKQSDMPGLPDPDWIVNGLPAWRMATIRAYVLAERGWSPEQVAERDRLWPELRGSTRSRMRNAWASDPEQMAASVKRRAKRGAKTAKPAKAAGKTTKATKRT